MTQDVDTRQNFDAALAAAVEAATAVVQNNIRTRFTYPNPESERIEAMPGGGSYVRLVHHSHGSRSAYGFVRVSDGAILYAAGWKKPFISKAGPNAVPGTIRGSIYQPETWARCFGPYGVLTLDRR